MFNLKKLLFNPNFSNGIFFLLYLSLSIFFGYNLVKSCIYYEATSKILFLLVWLIVCIVEAALKWHNIIKSSPTKEIDKKPENQLFSKQWYSENLPSIIIMIMGMSIMIILLIIVTINYGWTTSYTVSDPKFDIINDWSSILLGVCCLLYSLERVERVKSCLDNKFFRSLKIIMIFSAFILSIIYASNLTEVP